ncbi:hypothetical protein [Pandoraea sp. SD6-2]|uniref:hypothetical protein n=1 Tax=Pandoraea sp. SD6-2 TaxID=1286093 RepID=UPI000330FBC4|nr:hypothetical protein [Pandoraea sp. SD6-2]EON13806.1 hypothetical protein C266_10214 [Pandoraea sp. SD6-2]
MRRAPGTYTPNQHWKATRSLRGPYAVSRTVEEAHTVTPEDPSKYVIGYEYGVPFVTGRDEDGGPLFGAHYGIVNGKVSAISYTVYDTQNVEEQYQVLGVTPLPTIVDTTPTYVPGYWIPGASPQHAR